MVTLVFTGRELGERMRVEEQKFYDLNFKDHLEDYDGDIEKAKQRTHHECVEFLFQTVLQKRIWNAVGIKVISKKQWRIVWDEIDPALELITDFDLYSELEPEKLLERTKQVIKTLRVVAKVSGKYIKLPTVQVEIMPQPDDIKEKFTAELGEQLVHQIVDAGDKYKHQSITWKEYQMICNRIYRYIAPVAKSLADTVQDPYDHDFQTALRVLHFLDLAYTEDDVKCGRSAGDLYYLLRFGHRE